MSGISSCHHRYHGTGCSTVEEPGVKVVQIKIANFRGIESADLRFDGHALLVGSNNVGKSTICEALDLVLGPDRLNRFPPVE
jgi:putative ATP-dependent endonuclease of the OLD family